MWNLQFVTEQIGWLVGEGSVALKTTDGGNTWINTPTPLSGYPYWDVSFLDTLFGYICTNGGQILRTIDGGLSWDVKQAGDNYGLFTISVVTRMKAVALGFAGKHVYTTDGGDNWVFITFTGSNEPNNIVFLDTLKGFAACFGGCLETTNSGVTWFPRQDMYGEGSNVAFPDDETGYLTGKNVTIEKSTNSGQNWYGTIINSEFTDVFFTDEDNGWFIGNQTLYQTTNGVVTLIKRSDFPGSRPSSVYFLDTLTGIVGAQHKIFKTYDGGNTWYEKNISGTTGNAGEFNRVFFINSNIGWAISYGYVIKTTDGGENWQAQINAAGLTSVHFTDSLNGWVSRNYSYNATPFKTTDGGNSWIEHTDLTLSHTYDIFFNDSLNGFIARLSELYRSTDSGESWDLVPNVTDFLSGRFSNKAINQVFLAGNRVYESLDNGETWNEVLNLRNELIEYIRLLDINQGYAVGSNGLILKLSDSTTEVGDNKLQRPSEYHLYQNYPNPFNPSTVICYQLPATSNVTLKVFDVLGNEVATLLNEEKPSGEYEVEFNGTNFPSGVYFCQLRAENYIRTIKMLLLK